MHFVRTQESHCYNGVMPLTRFKCNCFKPFVIVELSNFHCLVNPSLTSIFAHIRGGESSWHAMAFSWCNRFLSNIFRASLQQCNMKFRRHWNWKWAIERFFFDSRGSLLLSIRASAACCSIMYRKYWKWNSIDWMSAKSVINEAKPISRLFRPPKTFFRPLRHCLCVLDCSRFPIERKENDSSLCFSHHSLTRFSFFLFWKLGKN